MKRTLALLACAALACDARPPIAPPPSAGPDAAPAPAPDAAAAPAVDAGPPPSLEGLQLPAASRALFAASVAGRTWVVVESVASLDLPGGMRTVDASPGFTLDELPLARRMHLAEARDAADLARRVAALTTPARPSARGKDPLEHALVAVKTPADVAALIGPEGVDVVTAWEGAFGQLREHVQSTSVDRSPFVKALPAMAARVGACAEATCVTVDDDGARVVLRGVVRGGAVFLESVELDPPEPGPALSPTAPRLVDKGDPAATERVAKRLGVAGAVIASAPLRAGGAGSVGVVRTAEEGLAMVLADGAFEASADLAIGLLDPKTVEVGFVEADGDGRADVVVFGHASYVKKKSSFARLYASPRTVGSPGRVLQPDPGALFALRPATSLDAARAAALTAPLGAVAKADACRLVLALGDAKSAPRALASGAKLWAYGEPSEAEVSLHPATVAKVVSPSPSSCAELRCDPRRPVCTYVSEPAVEWFWIKQEKGAPKLDVVVRYDGS